jgi:hypothetical protein
MLSFGIERIDLTRSLHLRLHPAGAASVTPS